MGKLKYLISNPSFKISFWFRVGSYLKSKKGLWKLLYMIVCVWYKHEQYRTGIQLPFGTQVGGGLFFPHFGCQVIWGASIIGENCTIMQGVTIGSMRGKSGVPIIGDNVVLFSNSQVLGNVTIGNNAVVGAGAVVVKDVPSGAVVAGVPAKQVSMNGEQITRLYLI
ncbi:MAG: serine acetyltransferase [Salinivirgaceae bacterium]|nr:serine acetyltransferase [Salinivirgaceae bacterium]